MGKATSPGHWGLVGHRSRGRPRPGSPGSHGRPGGPTPGNAGAGAGRLPSARSGLGGLALRPDQPRRAPNLGPAGRRGVGRDRRARQQRRSDLRRPGGFGSTGGSRGPVADQLPVTGAAHSVGRLSHDGPRIGSGVHDLVHGRSHLAPRRGGLRVGQVRTQHVCRSPGRRALGRTGPLPPGLSGVDRPDGRGRWG